MNEQIQEIRYQVGEAWRGTYNAATTYGNANVVQDATGLSVYRSLKSGNVGHSLTDPQWWFCIIDMSSIKAEADHLQELDTQMSNNETQRIQNEQTRESHELARVNAETNRIYNEQQRENRETARIRAEQDRVTQENQRISQEQGRVARENQRIAAEQTRVNQESSRVASETQRQLNENNRVAAEQERITAEQTRVNQEQGRVNAEQQRVSDFNAMMQADQQAFNEAQASRQTAYQTAEGTESGSVAGDGSRWGAFKTNEAARDAKVDAKVAEITNLQQAVAFIEQSFGKYDTKREITLSQATAGKYVSVTGAEVSEAGYGISNSVEVLAGDILLIPSASAVPADVSVVARIVTRTYQKVINYTYTYQQSNPELYDTATADYDPTLVYTAVYDTSGETPVLTGWTRSGETYTTLPATHEVTESYYEPLMKQSTAAMPSTGYYIYLCPTPMTIVISGYTATVDGGVCLAVGWGIFKNICTNFVGAPGQAVIAQAFAQMQADIDGLKAQLNNLGETKAKCIDSEDLPKVCGAPLVIEDAGAPSVVPMFVGQRYHDTTNKKVYEAFAVTNSTADWILLN